MKTLILKELRENIKLAVVGLLLSLAVVVGSQLYYVNLIKGITSGVSDAQNYYSRLQPLTSGNFTSFSMILCVLVGVALGWLQIQNERHRDLWAFLVHRPVKRTTIFLSKVIAGLILYTMTVGFPLLYFVLWVRMPGNVAAPFEWGMAWPIMAGFLSGVAWYFAGMLTSIRQARWYGSRALGLGAALLALVAPLTNHGVMSWWIGVMLTVTLALAVWGAFQNHGKFEGQPVVGKAALTLALTPGAGLVFVAIIALALEIFIGLYGVTIWPHYALGSDGVIYKVIESNRTPHVLSLDGQFLKDKETGKTMEVDKFQRAFSMGAMATSWGKGFAAGPRSEWFNLFSANRHTLWFNVKHSGRIEAYDVGTRRFIGSLGPDGFAANKEGDGSGFLPNDRWQNVGPYDETTEPMASTKAVYEIDLKDPAVKPLWTVTGDDTIESLGKNFKNRNAVVMTRHAIIYLYLFGNSSKPIWSIPFDYSGQDYSTVSVYQFTKAGEPTFCVWIAPPFSADLNLEGSAKPSTQVVWLSGKGEVIKREDLPTLEPYWTQQIASRILNAVTPPVFQLIEPWLSGSPIKHKMEWHAIQISFGLGLVCVPLGLWLGRRYSFSAKKQVVWALFNLFFGVPGLLAFISVQEWPTRERCGNCGKLRVVSNEKCEHCGTGFPPPKKNGTEIFEVAELCER